MKYGLLQVLKPRYSDLKRDNYMRSSAVLQVLEPRYGDLAGNTRAMFFINDPRTVK